MPDFESGGILVFLTAMFVLFASYRSVMWMIDGNLEAFVGAFAIFVAFGTLSVSYWTPVLAVRAVVLLAVGSAIVFFPFAASQLDARSHRLQDTEELQKAHSALERDASNVAARFEVARVLYKYGLVGHAIAIADATEKTLPTDHDPVTNRSVRDMFKNETYRLKGWKESRIPPDAFRPVACPRCKRPNPAGTIVCQSCGGPFLLDVARESNKGERLLQRLVLAWIVVGITVCVAAFVGMQMRGGVMIVAITSIVAASGFAIASILRIQTFGAK